MRVFFPQFKIESHREPWESARIVVELARHGVECVLELDQRCDAVFVGSIFANADAAEGYRKEPYRRYVAGYRQDQYARARANVIHYCWDMYPWVVEDPRHPEANRWQEYMRDLRSAREVWVPSTPVQRRVRQYLDRDAVVMPVVISTWEPDEPPTDGGYVVDVMRKYPGDPNTGLVKSVCDELGVECRETGADLSWPEYKRTIANARLLVSAYKEASTGSLALLDGYRLGKRVLLSDSEWNGGKHILGRKGYYFSWESRSSLRDSVYHLVSTYTPKGVTETELSRAWVDERYGEPVFAKVVADRLREVVR